MLNSYVEITLEIKVYGLPMSVHCCMLGTDWKNGSMGN